MTTEGKELKQKRDAERYFNKLYDKIIDRIDVRGEITAREVIVNCGLESSKATAAFKNIMNIMVVQGKAKKIVNGRYEILKANRSNPIYRELFRKGHNRSVFAY